MNNLRPCGNHILHIRHELHLGFFASTDVREKYVDAEQIAYDSDTSEFLEDSDNALCELMILSPQYRKNALFDIVDRVLAKMQNDKMLKATKLSLTAIPLSN